MSAINVAVGQSSVVFSLRAGDRFMQETAINSNVIIQQGNNTLPLSTNLHFTRLITVEDVSADVCTFLVKTTRVIDTITYSGKQASYHSDVLSDTSSVVEKAIQNLLRQTTRLYVNPQGVILAVDNEFVQDPPDTLIRFAGLLPGSFDTPGIFGFLRNSLENQDALKSSRIDSLTLGNNRTSTSFSLLSKTDQTTTVRFQEVYVGEGSSLNTNGAFDVSNATGLLRELATKSMAVENYILNGVNYLISRSTAKMEVFIKL